jgi:lysine 2,3-aminomutase
MAHRLHTAADLAQWIEVTPEERTALESQTRLRTAITPYVASLMDSGDILSPIRRQVVPTAAELEGGEIAFTDSLAEESHSPVPGLVHRYPDRVLMLVATECATFCRFCTRSRLVGDPGCQVTHAQVQRQLAYIAAHPEIRDVLLSGGDPLLLSDQVLKGLLQAVRAIPHVEVVRIGTRTPVFLPQRITPALADMLKRFHPLWMNIHVNHPHEITPEAELALARLADAGIPLGSQTVLLAGVNDCPHTIMALVHRLTRNRVRPYYLYQCDMVEGASHFRTPVAKGIEISEALRGHTSGFAVPTFVIDAPSGGGKVPVSPNYLLSMSDSRVVVRNYEGLISTYVQPAHYRPHDPDDCPYCRAAANDAQSGIAGLLGQAKDSILPEGWQDTHRRQAATVPGLFDPHPVITINEIDR